MAQGGLAWTGSWTPNGGEVSFNNTARPVGSEVEDVAIPISIKISLRISTAYCSPHTL
jgi:hypothetical protein